MAIRTKAEPGEIVTVNLRGERFIVLRRLRGYYEIARLDGSKRKETCSSRWMTRTREKPWKVLRSKPRSDGYIHFACVSPDGSQVRIYAGCRYFTSVDDALRHWGINHGRRCGGVDDRRCLWSLVAVDRFADQIARIRRRART